MRARPVRIQARKVRSTARKSRGVARESSGMAQALNRDLAKPQNQYSTSDEKYSGGGKGHAVLLLGGEFSGEEGGQDRGGGFVAPGVEEAGGACAEDRGIGTGSAMG